MIPQCFFADCVNYFFCSQGSPCLNKCMIVIILSLTLRALPFIFYPWKLKFCQIVQNRLCYCEFCVTHAMKILSITLCRTWLLTVISCYHEAWHWRRIPLRNHAKANNWLKFGCNLSHLALLSCTLSFLSGRTLILTRCNLHRKD